MKIDKEKLKQLITWFLDSLESVETELLYYRAVCEALKIHGSVADMDQIVVLAKSQRGPSELMKTKYDALRKQFHQRIDAVDADQLVSELIQQWKPEGPAN